MITTTTKFRNILKSIADEGDVVGKTLYSIICRRKAESIYDYVNISDTDNTIVSVIPISRKSKLEQMQYAFILDGKQLKHDKNKVLLKRLGFNNTEPATPQTNTLYKIISEASSRTTGKNYCMLDIEPKSTTKRYSIFNKEYLHLLGEEEKAWALQNLRVDLKVGRFAKSVIETYFEPFTDKQYQDFTSLFKSKHDKEYGIFANFETISGDRIAHFYNSNNYDNAQTGTLHGSCMKNENASKFDIYTKNKNVSLLILRSKRNSEKIVGRALLWKLVDGTVFMDRTYYCNNGEEQLFYEYAKYRGFYYRMANRSSTEIYNPNGKLDSNKKIICQLENTDYTRYPYLDSMIYFTTDTKIITNNYNNFKSGQGYYQCQSTSNQRSHRTMP